MFSTFNFDTVVWQHVRRTLKRAGKEGLWYRFLKALTTIFFYDLIDRAKYIQEQYYFFSCSHESLVEKAKVYSVFPYQGETEEDFSNRVQLKRNLKRYDFSAKLVKAIVNMNISYTPTVYRAFCKNVVTVGVTKLGEGVCTSPLYRNFVWEAYLPDLSDNEKVTTYKKERIREQLDRLFPSLEIRIIEQRPSGLYEWEV